MISNSDKKTIQCLVILGPTSSGKSETAVRAAQKNNGEIISADSRQIYKDMDLGTGKVEGKWIKTRDTKIFIYKNIPHHLIDFQDPKKDYNISHFKKDCEEKIIEIYQRGKLPIICGGTGFWISSVIHGISLPQVKPDPDLRKILQEKNNQELFQKLEELDPRRAEKIDPSNKARLIRSIEIAQKMGKVPQLKTKSQTNGNITTREIKDYEINFYQFALDIPFEKLEKKIKERINKRYKQGMVKEVKYLKEERRLSFEKIQSFGLAYYWMPLFLQGKITEEEVLEKIYLAERRYAKKQLTWLKKEKGIKWIDKNKDLISLDNSMDK
ncbi:MAG: tRNA (adenosine(37)-N6)-dimethylallyltransferase MiaA [Candidatus Moraniibacteriota bacterium]